MAGEMVFGAASKDNEQLLKVQALVRNCKVFSGKTLCILRIKVANTRVLLGSGILTLSKGGGSSGSGSSFSLFVDRLFNFLIASLCFFISTSHSFSIALSSGIN